MIDAVGIVGSGGTGTAKAVSAVVPAAPPPAVNTFSPPSMGTLRVRVDNEIDLAILELRSMDSGDVLQQYPTEAQIQAFLRASDLEARQNVEAAAQSSSGSGQASTSGPAPSTASPSNSSSQQVTSTTGAPAAPAPTGTAGIAPAPDSVPDAPRAAGSGGGAAGGKSGATSVVV